jgi:ABC-2 type transport system permease protein
VNRALLGRTVSANAVRLTVAGAAIFAWGLLLPVIYATFGRELADVIRGNPLFRQFSQFGGGDLFSLPGAIALGFVHPFTVAIIGIFAVGYPAYAIAGERQRGTLEVILARPVSRLAYYVTHLVAGIGFVALLLAVLLVANVVSAAVTGVAHELDIANVPLLWLKGTLFFAVFVALGLAASASYERLAPALGITVAVLLVMYVINVVASLWPDAEWIGPYSLFEYVAAKETLQGTLSTVDLLLLGAVGALAVVYAVVVFPRRDLSAPS